MKQRFLWIAESDTPVYVSAEVLWNGGAIKSVQVAICDDREPQNTIAAFPLSPPRRRNLGPPLSEADIATVLTSRPTKVEDFPAHLRSRLLAGLFMATADALAEPIEVMKKPYPGVDSVTVSVTRHAERFELRIVRTIEQLGEFPKTADIGAFIFRIDADGDTNSFIATPIGSWKSFNDPPVAE